MGQWGDVYLQSLKENRPAEYARAEKAGTLQADAKAAERRAQAQFENVLAALRKMQPDPTDYPSRVQHHMTLESQARELVLDEVVVRPPNDSDDAP